MRFRSNMLWRQLRYLALHFLVGLLRLVHLVGLLHPEGLLYLVGQLHLAGLQHLGGIARQWHFARTDALCRLVPLQGQGAAQSRDFDHLAHPRFAAGR